MSSCDCIGKLKFQPVEETSEDTAEVGLSSNKVWMEAYGEEYYPQTAVELDDDLPF